MTFFFGTLAGAFVMTALFVGAIVYNEYRTNKIVEDGNKARQEAYDQEVAEGRMKTDGNG